MKREKLFIMLLFFLLLTSENVYAASVSDFCNSEYTKPFINIVGIIINLIKIGVPIILVVLGMIDMGKAVASQKDENIKKGQQILIKRCVSGAIVFFIVAIVQLLLGIVSKSGASDSTIWNCVCKFVGGCSSTNVKKTNGRDKVYIEHAVE